MATHQTSQLSESNTKIKCLKSAEHEVQIYAACVAFSYKKLSYCRETACFHRELKVTPCN